jgi:hypothetical protein
MDIEPAARGGAAGGGEGQDDDCGSMHAWLDVLSVS